MEAYPPEVEHQMQQLYRRLNERDRRAYAAVEVAKLGYGGASYIYKLLGCDSKTVKRPLNAVNRIYRHPQPVLMDVFVNRVAGEKKSLADKGLEAAFIEVLEEHTAGDPMRPEVRWTNLACWDIAEALADAGYPVSRNSVRYLLKSNGYVKRKAQKSVAMGHHVDQNTQFENIR